MDLILRLKRTSSRRAMEAAVACDWEHTHKTRSGYLSDEGVREDTVPPTKRACPEAPSYGDTPSECTEPQAALDEPSAFADDSKTNGSAIASACREVLLKRRRKSLAYVYTLHFLARPVWPYHHLSLPPSSSLGSFFCT